MVESEIERELIRQREILKVGAIPEFVQVKDVFQIYKAFTEANLKNKMLLVNLRNDDEHKVIEQQDLTDTANIKDDLVLI